MPGWSQSWWKVDIAGLCPADTEVALRHPGLLGFGMSDGWSLGVEIEHTGASLSPQWPLL